MDVSEGPEGRYGRLREGISKLETQETCVTKTWSDEYGRDAGKRNRASGRGAFVTLGDKHVVLRAASGGREGMSGYGREGTGGRVREGGYGRVREGGEETREERHERSKAERGSGLKS